MPAVLVYTTVGLMEYQIEHFGHKRWSFRGFIALAGRLTSLGASAIVLKY